MWFEKIKKFVAAMARAIAGGNQGAARHLSSGEVTLWSVFQKLEQGDLNDDLTTQFCVHLLILGFLNSAGLFL